MRIDLLASSSTLTITNYSDLREVSVTIGDSKIATITDKTGGNYDVTAISVGSTNITITAKDAENVVIPVNVTYDIIPIETNVDSIKLTRSQILTNTESIKLTITRPVIMTNVDKIDLKIPTPNITVPDPLNFDFASTSRWIGTVDISNIQDVLNYLGTDWTTIEVIIRGDGTKWGKVRKDNTKIGTCYLDWNDTKISSLHIQLVFSNGDKTLTSNTFRCNMGQ